MHISNSINTSKPDTQKKSTSQQKQLKKPTYFPHLERPRSESLQIKTLMNRSRQADGTYHFNKQDTEALVHLAHKVNPKASSVQEIKKIISEIINRSEHKFFLNKSIVDNAVKQFTRESKEVTEDTDSVTFLDDIIVPPTTIIELAEHEGVDESKDAGERQNAEEASTYFPETAETYPNVQKDQTPPGHKTYNKAQVSKKFDGYEDRINKNENGAGGFCSTLTFKFLNSRLNRLEQEKDSATDFRDELVQLKQIYDSVQFTGRDLALLNQNEGLISSLLESKNYHANAQIYFDPQNLLSSFLAVINIMKEKEQDHALCYVNTYNHVMGLEISKKENSFYHIVFYDSNTGTPITINLTEEQLRNPSSIDRSFIEKILYMPYLINGTPDPLICSVHTRSPSEKVSRINLISLEERNPEDINRILLLACQNDDLELVQEIFEKYQDVINITFFNQNDRQKRTLAYEALSCGNEKIINILLKAFKPKIQKSNPRQMQFLFQLACAAGDVSLVKKLLTDRNIKINSHFKELEQSVFWFVCVTTMNLDIATILLTAKRIEKIPRDEIKMIHDHLQEKILIENVFFNTLSDPNSQSKQREKIDKMEKMIALLAH